MNAIVDALKTFCQLSGPIVNVYKTKMMELKAVQPRHYVSFAYKRELIQVVQRFKYLGIDVPRQIGELYTMGPRIQAGWNSYYMYEN